MRTRGIVVGVLVAAGTALGAGPAAAHHTEQHTAPSCYADPPPQNPPSGQISGWSYYTGNPNYGIRSGDVYVFADGDASQGLQIATFQPYWDDQGVVRGPAWVDVGVTVGGGGGPVAACNESRPPGVSIDVPY